MRNRSGQITHQVYIDGLFWLYTIFAATCLLISLPATYSIVAPFHNSGGNYGLLLSLGTMALFEIGAVMSKIAGHITGKRILSTITVGLLLVTTLGNAGHAYELFMHANTTTIPPILAWAQGWPLVAGILSFAVAGLLPLFLWIFMALALERRDELVGLAENPFDRVATQVVSQMAPEIVGMVSLVGALNDRVDRLLLAPPLARQMSYPAPVEIAEQAQNDETAFYGVTEHQNAVAVLPEQNTELNQNSQNTALVNQNVLVQPAPEHQNAVAVMPEQCVGSNQNSQNAQPEHQNSQGEATRTRATDEQIRTLLQQGKSQRVVKAELQSAGLSVDTNRVSRLAKEMRAA